MGIKTLYILIFTIFWAGLQKNTLANDITAEIRNSKILIGEQTEIIVNANDIAQQSVEFPSFDSLQTVIPGIEVLSFRDSSFSNGGRARIYTITSFDSADYIIPQLDVKINGKIYHTNELNLMVSSVEVDTANVSQIFDLKSPMEPAFSMSEWLLPLILSVICLLVSIVLTYVIIRIKDNKPIIRHIKLAPFIPPHTAAMNEIDKIKDEKLNDRSDTKTYYTRLTDTVRKYLYRRYGFPAMEMTTDEIVVELEKVNTPEAIEDLHHLFTTADLVKFAKGRPELSEDDKNLSNAIDYIQQTKKDEISEIKPQEIEFEDVHSKKTRLYLYAGIAITLTILIVTVIYLLNQIFMLNY